MLIALWFPQWLNVHAASYDVCFLKVFLLEIFISRKHIIGLMDIIYVYNLCRFLVKQSLFLEFVFGTMLLISNKGPGFFFLFLLLLCPDNAPLKWVGHCLPY